MSAADRRAKRIVVVGGGVTGLSAAFELERALFAGDSPSAGSPARPSGGAPAGDRPRAGASDGASLDEVELLLLEATGRLGGKIGTIAREGFLLESGPDSFLTRKAAAVELCAQIGIASRFIGRRPVAQRALVRRGAALYPLPEGLSGLVPADLESLGKSPLLSAAGRERALEEPDVPPRRREEPDDESVAAFMSRRFGREAFDLLIEPLVSGIFAADADSLSLLATYPNLREAELRHGSLVRGLAPTPGRLQSDQGGARSAQSAARTEAASGQARSPAAGLDHSSAAGSDRKPSPSDPIGTSLPPFASFPSGMAELVRALTAALVRTRIEKGSRVDRIELRGAQWRLTLEGGMVVEADAVILATPAHASAPILEPVSSELAALLAELPYASTALLHLAFRSDARQSAGTRPGEGLRPNEGSRPPGAVSPADALRGHGYLIPAAEGSPFLACTMSSRKWEGRAPEGDLLLRLYAGRAGREPPAAEELRRAARIELERTLGISAAPFLSEIVRWERAMPQYTLGHLERLAGIERHLEAIREQGPPLFLAGAYFHGVGIPDCIHSGREAARGALAQLGLAHERKQAPGGDHRPAAAGRKEESRETH